MPELVVGDDVRIDIPDKTDPDFDRYHGLHGTIIEVRSDDVDQLTGDNRDAVLYRVEIENGDIQDFRWRDLRPTH